MNEPQDTNRSADVSPAPTDSLSDEAARAGNPDRSCGGDAATRTNAPTPDQDAAAGRTTDASPGISDDELLACLSPATRPDSLGRMGHYEVLEVLGRGGFGIVFRAFDETLQRVVAIKMMSAQRAATPSARQRFLREARAAAKVRNEHVVQIYAVEEQPVPYLVMEYIPGITLQQKLAAGPLETAAMLQVAIQITRGLAAAHAQGLIHRDIKPSNILLEKGVEPHAKLTDFGLARAADDASLSQSGMIAGTPMYMAPEQAQGKTIDQRADLFSLGSVFYAMLSGRPPFRASGTMAVLKRVCEDAPPPIRDVIPQAPEWLCNIVAKLHAKNPEDRFQTAGEVADLLAQHLAHLRQPQQVPMPAFIAVPTVDFVVATGGGVKSRRGSKTIVAAAAGLLLLAAGIPLVYFATRPHEKGLPEGGKQLVEASDHFFDALKRENIQPSLLALAGGGDPDQAPPELVAMLGDGRFLLPHGGLRHWMAHSPDGKLLAVPCGNDVALFDAHTGALVRTLRGHTSRVVAVTFSSDGQRLASCATDDHTARVWNVQTGEAVAIYEGHTTEVWCVAFSPDGKRAASGDLKGNIRIWETATGKELVPLTGHSGRVYRLTFSPDGARIVSIGSDDKKVMIWDASNGRLVKQLEGHTATLSGLALSATGDRMATGGENEMLLWTVDWRADEYKFVRKAATPAGWLAFDPDGRTILAGEHEAPADTPDIVTRWDVVTGERVAESPSLGNGHLAFYDLSPDGKTLFAIRYQPDVPYVRAYDAHTGKELFPRQGHTGPVRTVAISQDGRVIASGGDDRTVRLWDLANPRADGSIPLLHTLTGHDARILGVAFSPDGELLASGSAGDRDGTVILWSVSTGEKRYVSSGHTIPADGQPLAFGPPAGPAPGMVATLAIGQEDGTAKLLEVPEGVTPDGNVKARESIFPRQLQSSVRAVAFSRDGRMLALSGHDGQIQLCDGDGRWLNTFKAPGAVRAVFSPDGRLLAGVSDYPDGGLRIWNVATKEVVGPIRLSYTNNVVSVAFDPEGRLVGMAAHDGMVRFWDCANSTAVFTIGPGPFGSFVHQIAFSPHGGYAVTANENGTVSILRVPPPPPPYTPGPPITLPDPGELSKRPRPADALEREDIPPELLKESGGGDPANAPPELVAVLAPPQPATPQVPSSDTPVHPVAISPDGKTLASAGADRLINLWNLADAGLRSSWIGHDPGVCAIAFSPDSKLLASPGSDGTIRLWETSTGKPLRTLHAPGSDQWSVAFSPDGSLLASCGRDGAVCLWNVADGKTPTVLRGNSGTMPRLAFSPDGRLLATAGLDDRRVRLWDISTRWQLREFPQDDNVHGVAFSPDGRYLAIGSEKKRQLWDLTRDQLPVTLDGGGLVAFRPDGRLLATGGSDGTVRLWEVGADPNREKVLTLFQGGWMAIAFTPDGRHLATGNPDGTVYVLRLAEPGAAADNAYLQRREIRQFEGWAKALAELKAVPTKIDAVGKQGGEPFEDVPPDRSLLVGVNVTAGHEPVITSLRPIFLTRQGLTEGPRSGDPTGPSSWVVAKRGYAVGDIAVRTGDALDGFKIIFMRIDGARLDPQDHYESPWLGGRGGGQEKSLGGDGRPVIGIHGAVVEYGANHVPGRLGLVQLDLEAPQ